LLLFAKGVGMGAVDVVPGISGGTVALITGIYEQLLLSINAIDAEALRLLMRFRLAEFWHKINGNFLTVLLCGILTSLLGLSRGMIYMLINHPIIIWSFFFGLILISAPLVLRKITDWNMATVFSLFVGVAIAYLVTRVPPAQTPANLFFIFCAGTLSVCAMILPGLSGAFILLLLGKYQFIAGTLPDFNLPVLAVFFTGCVAGLLSFSRILTWILKNYHNATVALLAGFMLGSLNKVWPWRQVLEYVTDRGGKQIPAFDKSILPWNYFELTGKDPQVFQAIMMMAVGVFIVVLIEKIAERLKTKI
jgi:putative membrane protein